MMKLSNDIKLPKEEISAEEKKRHMHILNDNGVNLVNNVLNSVTQQDVKTTIDLESKPACISNYVESTSTKNVEQTPYKMTIVADQVEIVGQTPGGNTSSGDDQSFKDSVS